MNLKFTVIFSLSLFFVCFTDSAFSSPFRGHVPESFSLLSGHNEKEIKSRILKEYSRWEGVKYKFGGDSVHGIDCSALMQVIYHAAFPEHLPKRLPRTTAQQISHGISADKHDLRAGDLVFFQMTRNERHVGVYIGDSQFVHASSSQGVIISSLTNDYWTKRYSTARRILG